MPLWKDFENDFGLPVKRKQKIRDVFRITTTGKRELCYKPYQIEEAEVAFLRGLFVHLDAKGFKYAPKPIEGPHHKLWSFHQGQYWLLTNWVKGRSPVFSRRPELMKGFRTLAKFHRLAEGLSLDGIPEARIRYEHLYKLPEQYRSELHKFGKLDRFIPNCDRAEAYCQEPAVIRAVEHERAAGAYTHGDYNYPNLVLDRSRHLHLIDLENAAMNARVTDLAHILYRNYPWDADGVLRGVQEYERKRPLSGDDRHLLYMLLLLPYPLVRAMRQFQTQYHRHIKLPSSTQLTRYTEGLGKLL